MKNVFIILLAVLFMYSLTACTSGNHSTPTVYPTESENVSTKIEETKPNPSFEPLTTEVSTTQRITETTIPVSETVKPALESTQPVPETTQPVPETTQPVPETTQPVPETTKPIPTQPDKNTYVNNPQFEVVEMGDFKDSFGSIVFVDKVLAKENVTISATVLAYDKEENVIGKSTDEITLTAGSYNFFRYSFESDISDAYMTVQWSVKDDSVLAGPRNSVEMVKYNRSGNSLYITFKQKTNDLGSLAKFKILYYKDDKIIDTEKGYFLTYTENLSGKGSTDVASIWVSSKDFDRIECFFEP